jgi:hypothetical protein
LPTRKGIFAEPEIATHKGKPLSVVIPITDYKEVLETVEDARGIRGSSMLIVGRSPQD